MEDSQIPPLPWVLFQDAAIQLWLTHQAVALPGRRARAGLARVDTRSHPLQACPISSGSEPTSAPMCRVGLFPEPSHQSR